MFKELYDQEQKDKKILKEIENKVSYNLFDDILSLLSEHDYTCDYAITDHPEGEFQIDDDFEHIEGVYVNQSSDGGMTGDDWIGTCCVKLKENEYFKFWYDC